MNFLRLLALFPALVFAAGGVTMQYNSEVYTLKDGDIFYTDQHYRAPFDTIKATINGRLGNSNIASTANINPSKLDSTGRLLVDSVIAKSGVRSVGTAKADSLYAAKGIKAVTGVSSATVTATGVIKGDSLYGTTGIGTGGSIRAVGSDSTSVVSSIFAAGTPLTAQLSKYGPAYIGTIWGNSRAGALRLINSDTGSIFIGSTNEASGSLIFGLNNAEVARINTSGRLGLNNPAPVYGIDNYGSTSNGATLATKITAAGSLYAALRAISDVGSFRLVVGNAAYTGTSLGTVDGSGCAMKHSGGIIKIATTDPYDVQIGTNDSLRATFSSSGLAVEGQVRQAAGTSTVSTGTLNIDCNIRTIFRATVALTGTTTFNLVNAQAGATYTIMFTQGSSARTVNVSASGVTLYQSGTTTSGSGTIAVANAATVNAYYTLTITFPTATTAFVSVH